MNFIDRVSLGETFADTLIGYRGKDAIILCVNESSLLTCLTLAMKLRAWVYPLVFVPVYSTSSSPVVLGAVYEGGGFYKVPSDDTASTDQPDETQLAPQKARAAKEVGQELHDYGLTNTMQIMNGRDVIVAGDVVTDALPLLVAQRVLQHDLMPKSVTAIVGNATPATQAVLRTMTDQITVLDVLGGLTFDDDHYFEQSDAYSSDEKRQLMQNIATYWQ